MSYDIGSYVDLSYLNKKLETKQKKSTKETLYAIGTAFTFQLTAEGFKAAIKIPVAYA